MQHCEKLSLFYRVKNVFLCVFNKVNKYARGPNKQGADPQRKYRKGDINKGILVQKERINVSQNVILR